MKITQVAVMVVGIAVSACSHQTPPQDMINVDISDDVPTLDPAQDQDTVSARVSYDLFEGLTSFDQSNQVIPGLASSWELSPDGKRYTFHLRDGIKFSNGAQITAQDIVFSWQRVADPKVASPYNFLLSNLVNGSAVIAGKLAPSKLGIMALNATTLQVQLIHPDINFLQICSIPNLATVSKAALSKYGTDWTDPKHLVTSGAYQLSQWIVKGHLLLTKNPYYYAAAQVAINKVNFLPLVDTNAALNQYLAGEVDITSTVPTNRYRALKNNYPHELHTVTQEGLYYYAFNLTEPKFKNSVQLRQALSMAVDRRLLVKDILGAGQVAAYSYTTATIESGKFADLNYAWANQPRRLQLATAQQLFKQAGYGPQHPLNITINYNTNEGHQKIALAIAAMWQQAFGPQSIHITPANQEWKTFIHDRNTGNYDIARDGWIADYNSVNNYTDLFRCGNSQNHPKYCNPHYDQLLQQADNAKTNAAREDLIRRALTIAQNDYAIIPLYQYTYSRLVSPRVKGYTPETNHFDHVLSKWYHF